MTLETAKRIVESLTEEQKIRLAQFLVAVNAADEALHDAVADMLNFACELTAENQPFP